MDELRVDGDRCKLGGTRIQRRIQPAEGNSRLFGSDDHSIAAEPTRDFPGDGACRARGERRRSMKLVLHILIKDLRRQRLEISGYCLAVVAWAWREAHPTALEWMRQPELLPMMMFGLRFLVTIRAVQGESL